MEKIKKKRVSGGLTFLLVVLGIYVVVGFFDTPLALEAIIHTGRALINIAPILVIVFFIIYLINRYLDIAGLQKYVGSESGLRGWLYAVIAGIAVTGPPYVLYPLFGDLQKNGMRNALLAVVLYNRNVKIPFVPVMIYYFDAPFTVVVSVYIVLFSIVNGILVEALVDNNISKERSIQADQKRADQGRTDV